MIDPRLAEVQGLRPEPGGISRSTIMRGTLNGDEVIVKLGGDLAGEWDRLWWLDGRLPTPHPLQFSPVQPQLLVQAAMPGITLDEILHTSSAVDIGRLLGLAIRMIHDLSIADCLFRETLDVALARAEAAIAGESVRLDLLDPRLRATPLPELLGRLQRERPAVEDLVVTHGDIALANVFTDGSRVSGIVSLGRLGVADRYRDLAICVRDLSEDAGPDAVRAFLTTYGLQRPDSHRLNYYALLDELR